MRVDGDSVESVVAVHLIFRLLVAMTPRWTKYFSRSRDWRGLSWSKEIQSEGRVRSSDKPIVSSDAILRMTLTSTSFRPDLPSNHLWSGLK